MRPLLVLKGRQRYPRAVNVHGFDMMHKKTWLALLTAGLLAACGSDESPSNNANNLPDSGTNSDVGQDTAIPDMGEEDAAVDLPPELPPPGVERLPVGFSVLPPIPASCDNPDSRQRVPFIFTSNDVVPIVAGDLVFGREMLPNSSVDTGSIAFRRPRVSVPETTCVVDADCDNGFHCAAGGLFGAPAQCTLQTGVELIPNTVRNDFDSGLGDRKQIVGVMIENTAMLEGRLPLDSGALFDDGVKDILINTDRASDAARVHREAIKSFMVGLASVASPQNTQVGVWWFAGKVPAETRPLVSPMELQDHFVNDLSIGESLIDTMPDPAPKPSNLYQALMRVVSTDFGLAKYADHEKFLYVFTDGPNEVYDADATYSKVVDELQAKGIHLVIVHLDVQVDPTLIRDLPTIYGGNTACQDDPACGARTCTTNTDCQNYEVCRQAEVYGETAAIATTLTSNQYCMPTYVDGRIGPIDQFADLACRTGGNYIYVTDPEQMRAPWRILPSQIDGQWSVEADFSLLSDPDVPPGFYQFSSVVLGLLGGRDLSATLTGPPNNTSIENRPLLRLGRVRNQ